MIGQGPLMQKLGNVVHLRVAVNVEYKKDTVPMMGTVSRTLNVEQEIAKIKILCLILPLVLIAAMPLFPLRCKNYLNG